MAKKTKVPKVDWDALRAKVLATPVPVLKKAVRVDGWTICHPDKFLKAGLDPAVVAAFTRVIQSDTSDHKTTIFGPDGKPVPEIVGVYGLSLLEFIASAFGVTSEKNGRGFRQADLAGKLLAKWG